MGVGGGGVGCLYACVRVCVSVCVSMCFCVFVVCALMCVVCVCIDVCCVCALMCVVRALVCVFVCNTLANTNLIQNNVFIDGIFYWLLFEVMYFLPSTLMVN